MMALMDVFISPVPLTMLMLLLVLLTKSTSIATNTSNFSSSSSANSHVLCIQSEREALLKFKEDVTDPSNRLATWAEEGDCCKWASVVCNNVTGHVQALHLRTPSGDYNSVLGGKINPSLFNMRNLRYFDLSHNNFSGMVPSQLGNLSSLHYLNLGYQGLYAESLHWLSRLPLLRYLDLSYVNLSLVPDWLQVTNMLPSLVELHLSNCGLTQFPSLPVVNFTNLRVLDLSLNLYLKSSIPNWLCSLKDLDSLNLRNFSLYGTIPMCLQNMTSLRELDLSFNFLNSTIPNWLYSLSHLEHLNLGFNHLQGSISSAIGNLTSAITLDLSYNKLEGKMPKSFGDLCSLREIEMSRVSFGENVTEVLDILSRCILDELETLELNECRLSGHFSDVIEQLGQYSNNLATLRLARNSLYGPIPVSIVKLSSIRILYLSQNKLTGSLPYSLGQLASLEEFSIDQNSLQGVVSEVHFANLTRLKLFSTDGNLFTFRVGPNWVPPFQIARLMLRCSQLGQQFPTWLQSQKHLVYLDISCAGISDTIPSWFWNLASQLRYLNISHNHIHGGVEYIPATDEYFSVVDLGSNHLKGPLPDISCNVTELYLSHNSFSGSLSSFLCYKMGEKKKLVTLDLEENLLSGEISNCWMYWPMLKFVHLGNNYLTGLVPSSMGFLSQLKSLHLRHNNLSGGFPLPLQNCTELLAIDLSENQLSGEIPTWVGERLSKLKILILQSNKFHGHLPVELCRLSSLQIMVFSHNNLSGIIPRCFNNISAMVNNKKSDVIIAYSINSYGYYFIFDHAILVMKGKEAEYSTNLLLVTLMDLSDNNLSGEIPQEVTNLVGLQCLNLSKNGLTGRIPWEVGSMTSLECIDFSMNQLSGEIPPSMSSLTFLSLLNLSNNNLTGRIPSSTQLQSLDSSSFIGNKLCGPPLTKDCPISTAVIPNVGNGEGKASDGPQVEWFYVCMGFGFVVGFWGLMGPILFNKSWRFSYYQFLDNMWFKFCGIIRKCC